VQRELPLHSDRTAALALATPMKSERQGLGDAWGSRRYAAL
jgi:hypothetical protein